MFVDHLKQNNVYRVKNESKESYLEINKEKKRI